MLYLISILVLVSIVLQKVWFLWSEGGGSLGIFGLLSLLLTTILIIAGSVSYFRKHKTVKHNFSWKKLNVFLLSLILITICLSFYINFVSKSHDWDSVALYDARAKYLLGGTSFSKMPFLSKYDPNNFYYYLLYPPYTSLVHYSLYKVSINFPVNVFYSFELLVFSVAVYIFFRKRLSETLALLITFISVSNSVIFSASLQGYTNLSFALQICLGIFLLADYLRDGEKWNLLLAAPLIISSQWVRFLEPIWLVVVLSLALVVFQKSRRKGLLLGLAGIAYGLMEYLSWKYFMAAALNNYQIVKFGLINFLEPIVGIFTGSLAKISVFFLKSSGTAVFIYLISTLGGSSKEPEMIFFRWLVALSLLMYLGGLYFVSFQTNWWQSLGESFVRSSMFLIPACVYLLTSGLTYFTKKK